jgi:hypothetical protein
MICISIINFRLFEQFINIIYVQRFILFKKKDCYKPDSNQYEIKIDLISTNFLFIILILVNNLAYNFQMS